MRFRPRTGSFAALLVVIMLPVVAVLALGSRHSRQQTPATVVPPSEACVFTVAGARATAAGVVKGSARVTVPIAVAERARGPRGVVTVTSRQTVVQEATVRRAADVTVAARGRGRACAHGTSSAAARGAALRRAFEIATLQARAAARRGARARLEALIARLTPAAQATARQLAADRARSVAASTQRGLSARASREARARAGLGEARARAGD